MGFVQNPPHDQLLARDLHLSVQVTFENESLRLKMADGSYVTWGVATGTPTHYNSSPLIVRIQTGSPMEIFVVDAEEQKIFGGMLYDIGNDL